MKNRFLAKLRKIDDFLPVFVIFCILGTGRFITIPKL
jgi:hypothetical protein